MEIFHIKSFTGDSFNGYDEAVKKATDKADNWIDDLATNWNKIEIVSMSTQCLNEDYLYIITLAVKCDDHVEDEV